MAKRVKKYRVGQRSTLDIVIAVILGFMTLAAVFPFYQVVLLSFADMASYAKHPLYLLPYCFDLTGYKTIFEDPMFFTSLGVTLFITLVGTSLNMFLSVMGAYVLSRKYLMGRKVILNLIIFTMLFNGGLIPTYLVIKNLKLVNTVWAMILPCGISTYYLIIMKNYFMSLPDSLLEAARLDGANEWSILTRVVLPISVPFMATFILFYAVERWNEWYLANLYINKSALYPLQTYLRNVLISMSNTLNDIAKQFMQGHAKVNSTAVQMATIVVATVPILCVYPFVQRHFVKGVMVGGIKE
ncbi:MAG: carbohydrate ABC transporter permease [Clostridiales bacterium]|nr:carbohydrate ABC transporter permease [Clostridiales bacterium]MCI6433744.1 carbohydrate ABC transporter permease [Clostridiales bacterium]